MEGLYNEILHIEPEDDKQIKSIIKNITLGEREDIMELSQDLGMFSNFLITEIKSKLDEYGIDNTLIDLDDVIGITHTIIIAEYKTPSDKKILVDPSYVQVRTAIIPDFEDLEKDGITEINDTGWNTYLTSISSTHKNRNLGELLIAQKKGK